MKEKKVVQNQARLIRWALWCFSACGVLCGVLFVVGITRAFNGGDPDPWFNASMVLGVLGLGIIVVVAVAARARNYNPALRSGRAPAAQRTCPNCGVTVGQTAVRCTHCSFNLSRRMKVCPHCGEDILQSAIKCRYCKSNLGG